MNYINTSLNWEEVFIQEALDLEEKMESLTLEDLKKSRLRLSFENGLLDWQKYETWFTTNRVCKSVKSDITSDQMDVLISRAILTYESYSKHEIWSEDLIPISVWDGHVLVFGLDYNPALSEVKNAIFILADASTLTKIHTAIQGHFQKNSSLDTTAEESSDVDSIAAEEFELMGLDINAKASHLNFQAVNLVEVERKQEQAIWDYLSERHEEYTFEAKKQFNAYAVLKIEDGKTRIYRMDKDLEKVISNVQIFQFNVTDESNPFGRVYSSGGSDAFNVTQLESLAGTLKFKYGCITAIKRGTHVVGFLVGFKTEQLAESDQELLEDLAKETA